jgi:hypothetical protein
LIKDKLASLLFLWGLPLALIVWQGDLGSVDTTARYQAARWLLWQDSPVIENVYLSIGPSGVAHHPYGLGQTLVMLPLELLASLISDERAVRIAVVSLLMQMISSGLLALGGFRLLEALNVSRSAAASAVLLSMTATSVLHYVQFAQENLLSLVCLVWGCYWWIRQKGVAAGCCFGLLMLMRLTSLLMVIPMLWALFPSLPAVRENHRWLKFAAAVMPFAMLDRWYQWVRFGDWTHTFLFYSRAFVEERVPPNWPWSGDWWTGLTGPFVSYNKSIFLYDPLLLLLPLVWLTFWQRWQKPSDPGDLLLPRMLVGCASALLLLVVFHARFYTYSGEVSWGDRFVATPIHLMLLLSIPTICQQVPRWISMPTLVIALSVQVLSILLIPGVEAMQTASQEPRFEIGLRVENIWSVFQGQLLEGIPKSWQVINLLPWLIRVRRPELSALATALWTLALIGATVCVSRILTNERVRTTIGQSQRH